jgi:hypothetical protein
MVKSAGDHLTRRAIEMTTMTTYATVCSENVPLRFSCRMTDLARYAKENFIFSCKVLSFGMKNAKEKLAL